MNRLKVSARRQVLICRQRGKWYVLRYGVRPFVCKRILHTTINDSTLLLAWHAGAQAGTCMLRTGREELELGKLTWPLYERTVALMAATLQWLLQSCAVKDVFIVQGLPEEHPADMA